MTSPTCTVNSASTIGGVNVGNGTFVTIALADVTGVTQWAISCVGTDDLQTPAAVTAALSINQTTKTATFSAPSNAPNGSALIFQSVVNNGRDINGNVVAAYTTTFGVFVLAGGGLRVFATNQTTEGDATYGYVSQSNAVIRTAALVTAVDVNATPNTIVKRGANADINLASALTFASTPASSITQSVLAGTGATAGLALSLIAQAGQQQSGANANNNGGNAILSGGAAGTGGSGAVGTDGSVFLRGSSIQIRDVANNRAAYILIAPTGSTLLQFEKGVTPGIGQDAQTTDVACVNLTLAPQAAFASATVGHRQPGNVVVALTDSTNGGGQLLNPAFAVTQSGRPACLISSRRDSASSAYGAIWLGNVTTATATEQNMCFGSDGASVAFLNAPSGGTLYLTVGLSTLAQVMTSAQNQIGIPQWTWNDGLTPSILQAQSTTGIGATFTLKAAQGKVGSVGGILLLGGGGGGTGGTNLAGATQVDLGTAVSAASAKLSLLVGGASVLDISQTAAATVTMTATSSLILKGAATWFTGNATGIGLYGATPVAQAARSGQLTGAFGSTGTAIVDATAAFSQSITNNNNRALQDAINRLELIVHNLGASA